MNTFFYTAALYPNHKSNITIKKIQILETGQNNAAQTMAKTFLK